MGEQGARREEDILEKTQRKVHNPMAKIQGKLILQLFNELFLESTRIFIGNQTLVCIIGCFKHLFSHSKYANLVIWLRGTHQCLGGNVW